MMERSGYLTIDDSPSGRMDDLTDFLAARDIPALFFCRGDMLDLHFDAAVRAVQKGFVLANHTYSHKRSSEEDFNWYVADIERCERLVEKAYAHAGIAQPGKYFRFPHIDRGTAGRVVDCDAYDGADLNAVLSAFAEGLNVKTMELPDHRALEKKEKLQQYLKQAGYVQPFDNVTHSWFSKGEIAAAYDCLFTFSNCDWMITERHIGNWPYKNVADLKQKALKDPYLSEEGGVNVILAHDQAEIVDVAMELIGALADSGMKFIRV